MDWDRLITQDSYRKSSHRSFHYYYYIIIIITQKLVIAIRKTVHSIIIRNNYRSKITTGLTPCLRYLLKGFQCENDYTLSLSLKNLKNEICWPITYLSIRVTESRWKLFKHQKLPLETRSYRRKISACRKVFYTLTLRIYN